MIDLLTWIRSYPIVAFWVGVFSLAALGIIAGIISTAFKGVAHMIHGVPPDPPVTKNITQVDCKCNSQCTWHEENDDEE